MSKHWTLAAAALTAAALVASTGAQDKPPAKKPPAKKPPAVKAAAGDEPRAAKPKVVTPTVQIGKVKAGVEPTPADAVLLAAADSLSLGDEAPFYRYVWVTDGEPETLKAMALAVNYPSHATTIVRPTPVVVGRTMLLRVDLRAYAPLNAQLEQFLKLWEDYQNDPKFSILLTKDVLANLRFPDGKVPVVKVRRKVKKKVEVPHTGEAQWRTEKRVIQHAGGDYKYPDDTNRVIEKCPPGSYSVELRFKVAPAPAFEFVVVEETVETKLTDVKDVDLLRLPGYHLPGQAYEDLSTRLRTAAPVVSHDYWVARHLSTIKQTGLFAELYGGRYYEFMLFKRDQKKGTDEDHLLESLGLGNVEAGLTAEKLFDQIRSDQRIAMFKSAVTGKPRRTDFLRSPTGRDSTGIVSITHDLFDEAIDIGQHPIMNLLKFKDSGREGIFEQRNGLHGFWLTDGDGRLADEAPPNLVADHQIPSPHTRRLQPAISCIRCHGLGRDDGWKPAKNEVKQLLAKQNRRGDVLGDLTNRGNTIADALDRLAGLYQGDPENRLLPRGRDDYAAAVLKATGPWAESKDQTDVVNLSAARISKVWDERHYQMVTPRQALRELGLVVAEKDAHDVLEAVLPPAAEDAVLGIVPEDPRVVALLAGLAINRVDWDLIYGFAATRAQRALKALHGEKK